MNDIEKAIVFLRDIKRAVDFESNKLDNRNCCFVRIPFERKFNIDTAIQELKEKQEREDMRCEKCKYLIYFDGYIYPHCEKQNLNTLTTSDYCSYFEAKK